MEYEVRYKLILDDSSDIQKISIVEAINAESIEEAFSIAEKLKGIIFQKVSTELYPKMHVAIGITAIINACLKQ